MKPRVREYDLFVQVSFEHSSFLSAISRRVADMCVSFEVQEWKNEAVVRLTRSRDTTIYEGIYLPIYVFLLLSPFRVFIFYFSH